MLVFLLKGKESRALAHRDGIISHARAAEAEAKLLGALVDAVEALVAGDAEGVLRLAALLARLNSPGGGLSWAAPWGATIVLTRGHVKPLLEHKRAAALPYFRRVVAVLALGGWTAEPVAALAAVEARLVALLPKHAERAASTIHARPHCAREYANRHGLSVPARCLSVFDMASEGRLPAARKIAPGGLEAFGAVFARAHAAAPALRARTASKMSSRRRSCTASGCSGRTSLIRTCGSAITASPSESSRGSSRSTRSTRS